MSESDYAAKLKAMQPVLESVGIPINEARLRLAATFDPAEIGFHLDALANDNLAKELWVRWFPEEAERIQDDDFRRAFRHWLSTCLSMGHAIGRLRQSAADLPDPHGNEQQWITAFEEAISTNNSCQMRLILNASTYARYQKTQYIGTGSNGDSWAEMLIMVTDGLFYELGILLPPFDIRKDETLASEAFQIEWNDLRLPATKGIPQDQIMVNDTPDRLRLLGYKGKPISNPANGNRCTLVSAEAQATCAEAGLTTWDSDGYIILCLSQAVRRSAGAFVNRLFADFNLNQLEQAFPALVNHVRLSLNQDIIVQTWRGLLREEISIRPLRTILEAMCTITPWIPTIDTLNTIIFPDGASQPLATRPIGNHSGLLPQHYVAHARIALKRYISHKYTRGQSTLIVYLLDRDTESRLVAAAELKPSEQMKLLHAIDQEVGNLPPSAQQPVILTTVEVQHILRTAIRHRFPRLAVLSYHELSPEMNIQPIARINPNI